MGLFNKIFGSSTFRTNKYDIDKKEYKQLKSELKEKYGIKLTRQQKTDFKDAVKNGKLGEYLDSSDIKLKNAMGLSLSTKVGKTDATQDIEEAKRLAQQAELDCDMDKVLKHIEQAKSTYPQFESQVLSTTGNMDKNLAINDDGAQKTFEKELSNPNGFISILDEMSLS